MTRQRRDQDVRGLHGRELLDAVGGQLPPLAGLVQAALAVVGGEAHPRAHGKADPTGGHPGLDQALGDLAGAVIGGGRQQHPRAFAGGGIGGELRELLLQAPGPQQPAHHPQRRLPVASALAGDPHQFLVGGADRRGQDTHALRVLVRDPPGRLGVQVMVRRARQVGGG